MKIHSPTFTREGETLRHIGKILDTEVPPKYKIMQIKDIYKQWCELIRKENMDVRNETAKQNESNTNTRK